MFHVQSPLIKIDSLSNKNGIQRNVYFKLENLQPSGSFKIRGIGHMIQTIVNEGNLKKLISTSGGNAGLAVATVARELNIPVDVFVPITTKPVTIQKLEALGARVFVGGANWNETDSIGRKFNDEVNGIFYVPPFDHPLLWEGHASLVEEIHSSGVKPDAIVLSVGGGGLLCGVQRGLERVGWTDVQVIAVETEGAASFAAGKAAGMPVMIPSINTVAGSLGSRIVTEACITSSITTKSLLVTDEEAVDACVWFLDTHRFLVEPACGASIASIVNSHRLDSVLAPSAINIVVVVCGGSNISFALLNRLVSQFKEQSKESSVSDSSASLT